ncbi:hypothetical protein V6N13_068465 [Hibiscus sabdariffa]
MKTTFDDEEREIELGPKCTLREQLEKDKVDLLHLFTFQFQFFFPLVFQCLVYLFSLNLRIQDDESLRSRKEQLLGTVDFDFVEV